MLISCEKVIAAKSGEKDAMEEMVTENSALIWSIARRYFGRGVEPEDLFQLGCIGFIKAIQGFDTSYGTQFSTYAVPKIAGEIRRFLRDDGPIKVSRGMKERNTLVKLTRQNLVGVLGREPHISEIAEECGLTVEEIAEAEISAEPLRPIQSENPEDGNLFESLAKDEGFEEGTINRIAIKNAVDELPDRERAIILLRYYKNLTQERVARIMGISQVQVSRVERKALKILRDKLV